MKESDYIYMGAWWDRKGENEIDLVCERSAGKKRSSPLTFFEKHPEMKNGEPKIKGLSLEDM